MGKRLKIQAVAALAALCLAGCAAPVAPLLLPAAVPAIIAGAGGGISYTLTNIAYRTIASPAERVEEASLEALAHMSIRVTEVEHRRNETRITARTRQLTIYMTLERMTPALTRMSVNAKRNLFSKDKTTAFEIIYQTEVALTGFAREDLEKALPARKGQGA